MSTRLQTPGVRLSAVPYQDECWVQWGWALFEMTSSLCVIALILSQHSPWHLSYTKPISFCRCGPAGCLKPVVFCTCIFATCRKLGAKDIRAIKPIDLMWYDVTGYEEGIEYQILDTTNQTHIKVSAGLTGSCISRSLGQSL